MHPPRGFNKHSRKLQIKRLGLKLRRDHLPSHRKVHPKEVSLRKRIELLWSFRAQVLQIWKKVEVFQHNKPRKCNKRKTSNKSQDHSLNKKNPKSDIIEFFLQIKCNLANTQSKMPNSRHLATTTITTRFQARMKPCYFRH